MSRFRVVIVVLLASCHCLTGYGLLGDDSLSRGPEKSHHSPLICHQCRSFEDGDRCIHLPANSSIFAEPCGTQHTSCMVKRYSYTENATSPVSLWFIERNCSNKCEPGCLILGERTKLYACISCCNEHYCNIGNGANNARLSPNLAAIIHFFSILLFFHAVSKIYRSS